jgi:hypothetical protein
VEIRGRAIAYEVQLSTISLEAARIRTEALQQSGFEVLWVTQDVTWVDRLPAVGLRAEAEQPERYRTTEVHGLYYSVMEGCLSSDPKTGELRPGVRRPALSTFLRDHLAQSVEWGPVRQVTDGVQNGWAAMDDWKRHIAWQAKRITELEARLHAQADTRARLQRQLDALRADTRSLQSDLTETQAELERRSNALDRERMRLAEANERCLVADDAAQQWQHMYAALKEELGATALRRWMFRASLCRTD